MSSVSEDPGITMKNKVILISIDGMRADGVQACGNPFVDEMKRLGSYTVTAQTVLPSVIGKGI